MSESFLDASDAAIATFVAEHAEEFGTSDVSAEKILLTVAEKRMAIERRQYGFSPSFEWAEVHAEGFYEVVYIVNDSGYGFDIFIADHPSTDSNLLAMCQAYATPSV